MACFWLVSPSARRCSYAAVRSTAYPSSRPSATSTASPSRAWKEARGAFCLAREVLTKQPPFCCQWCGRCSCPFVASGVLARCARRVEFLLLATRFEGSRRRRRPRLVPSRAKAAPSQSQTAAALGKTGRGPGNRGLRQGSGRGEDWWRITGSRSRLDADKTRQKASKITKLACHAKRCVAVLDSIDALLVIAAASVALESGSSCTRQGTPKVERLERGAPAVRAR